MVTSASISVPALLLIAPEALPPLTVRFRMRFVLPLALMLNTPKAEGFALVMPDSLRPGTSTEIENPLPSTMALLIVMFLVKAIILPSTAYAMAAASDAWFETSM